MSSDYTVMTQSNKRTGSLEVIAGCMFSGKSTELIRRIRQLENNGEKCIVFKPITDTRSALNQIASHNGDVFQAVSLRKALHVLESASEYDVFGFDEAQFFDKSFVSVCLRLVAKHRRVILAGLDLDYRGLPFGSMPILLSYANTVDKLHAICTICGRPASRSQRLINGEPASNDSPLILIGAQETYVPRCIDHHFVGKVSHQ
jgi:thymidine kinase